MKCWICGGQQLTRIRASGVQGALDSTRFKITDAAYGVTLAIDQCASCGFRQCSDLDDAVAHYESMIDDGYEASSPARSLQAAQLVQSVLGKRSPSGLRLLDVGAGSGLLVEQANAIGVRAEGVEPSYWLYQRATDRGLKFHHGVIPHPDVQPGYDLMTVVDVIEHVNDPVGLMCEAGRLLSDTGVGLVVTPDVSSFAARAMGWRWWHYRVAHIGYFNQSTLTAALDHAGLVAERWFRPTWHFPLDYLIERACVYVPGQPRLKMPGSAGSWVVPLNLFDSLAVVFRKR